MHYIKLAMKDIYFEPFKSNNIITLDCPNEHGGIGEMQIKNVRFHAGCWFSAEKLKFQICNLTYIEYCMENKFFFDETDWILFWQRPNQLVFSYEYWFNLAYRLNNLIHI